jgi:hypothetical protein
LLNIKISWEVNFSPSCWKDDLCAINVECYSNIIIETRIFYIRRVVVHRQNPQHESRNGPQNSDHELS